jgi:hypothetical protein
MRTPVRAAARLFGVAMFAASACASLAACGITQPKYVDHDESGDTDTSTPPTACETAALQAFQSGMQPVVAATCATAGCHLLTTVEGEALSASDASKNRAQLLKFSGGSADTLFNKISQSGQTHGGGDQSGALPKATIETWTAKEAACT